MPVQIYVSYVCRRLCFIGTSTIYLYQIYTFGFENVPYFKCNQSLPRYFSSIPPTQKMTPKEEGVMEILDRV